jgi:serine/threonine-protein kinase
VTGGAPVKLCDAQIPSGASWGVDDTILYGEGPAGIWRVSGQGGAPELLIEVDKSKGESAHGPQMLPGGDAVLFTLATGAAWDDARIVVPSLESGERKVLVEGGRDVRYVPTGHLAYAREATLFAVPFNIRRLEVARGPVSLVEGVRNAGTATGAAHFSLSPNGSLVYVPGDAGGFQHTLAWVDRQGREEALPAPVRPYSWVRVSPDGTRVAMEVQDPDNTDIWIYDLARRTSTRLTFASEPDRWPLWTPDGRRIV